MIFHVVFDFLWHANTHGGAGEKWRWRDCDHSRGTCLPSLAVAAYKKDQGRWRTEGVEGFVEPSEALMWLRPAESRDRGAICFTRGAEDAEMRGDATTPAGGGHRLGEACCEIIAITVSPQLLLCAQRRCTRKSAPSSVRRANSIKYQDKHLNSHRTTCNKCERLSILPGFIDLNHFQWNRLLCSMDSTSSVFKAPSFPLNTLFFNSTLPLLKHGDYTSWMGPRFLILKINMATQRREREAGDVTARETVGLQRRDQSKGLKHGASINEEIRRWCLHGKDCKLLALVFTSLGSYFHRWNPFGCHATLGRWEKYH